MNMEQLENHLRSWAPRRPSAKVEKLLFAAQTAVELKGKGHSEIFGQHRGIRFGWLAPVMAGFVFLCMLFNQHPVGNAGDGTNSGPLLAVLSSNQSGYFPILPLPRQQNRPASSTFEWTNGNGSFSSVRSLLGLKARN